MKVAGEAIRRLRLPCVKVKLQHQQPKQATGTGKCEKAKHERLISAYMITYLYDKENHRFLIFLVIFPVRVACK